MLIRNYQSSDCQKAIDLFYDTVHTVNAKNYDEKQLSAWAPKDVDLTKWNQSLMNNFCLVAEINGEIVGFGDITQDGYLDHLYVHKDFQGQGIASMLCDRLEAISDEIITHASITAKGFFLKRRYQVINKQTVVRREIELVNYVMKKVNNF